MGKPVELWETEWGPDNTGSISEVDAADWLLQRLIYSKSLGVEHTFFYELTGGSSTQALLSFAHEPRVQIEALNRFENAITGMTLNKSATFTFSSSDPNFVQANATGYLFQDASGNFAAVVWMEEGAMPSTWEAPVLATVTFTVPTPPPGIAAQNLVTGDGSNLQFTASGSSITIQMGGVHNQGYGRMGPRNSQRYAHRESYKAFIGPIPEERRSEHIRALPLNSVGV